MFLWAPTRRTPTGLSAANTKTCTHFKIQDKVFCFTGLLHNNELCRVEPQTHLWIQTFTYFACRPRYKLWGWQMVLFYSISRQDVNLPTGWKGSVLDWDPDFKVSGLCLVLHLALCKGWTHTVSGLPWLLRDLCREGLILSPLEFVSHWLCYFWATELCTGSGSLWKWLHAHSEIGCILATLRLIFQDVFSFLAAYWLRYFHLRETSSDNFVQNRRRKKNNQGLLKKNTSSWEHLAPREIIHQHDLWDLWSQHDIRGHNSDRSWSLSSHSFSSSGNSSFALGTGDSNPQAWPEGFSVTESAAPPWADQHPGEAAAPP